MGLRFSSQMNGGFHGRIKIMSEIVKEAWRKYLTVLQLHPLRTKAITAGVLVGCSDVIAQKISGIKRLQLRRLLLLMLYGLAYSGPFGHFLHKLMDVIFQGKKDNKTVAKKVLLEQLTSSPWNNFFFMMYYGLVVEGRPWGHVKNKVRKDYPSVQLTAWKFWPIVGWINYQYMPLQFRVLFHSFVASCWAIFLNLKARSVTAKKD
ncbi:peroxisomal membrane protein PMP22 [Capsicum annuum]